MFRFFYTFLIGLFVSSSRLYAIEGLPAIELTTKTVDTALSFWAVEKGSFWSLIRSQSFEKKIPEFALVKIEAIGKEIERKKIVVEDGEIPKYAISGTVNEALLLVEGKPPKYDISIWRISLSTGKILSKKELSKSTRNVPFVIQPSKNKGFLVFGTSYDADGGMDGWILRLNARCELQWEKRYDWGKNESVLSVVETAKGAVVLADSGNYNSLGQGPSDLWLFEIDEKGKKAKETKIAGGRVNTRGGQLLAGGKEGWIVSFTKTELPSVESMNSQTKLKFSHYISVFDSSLGFKFEKALSDSDTPTTPLTFMSASGKWYSAGAKNHGLWLAEISASSGAVNSEATVPFASRVDVAGFSLQKNDLVLIGQTTKFLDVSELQKNPSSGAPMAQSITIQRFRF